MVFLIQLMIALVALVLTVLTLVVGVVTGITVALGYCLFYLIGMLSVLVYGVYMWWFNLLTKVSEIGK